MPSNINWKALESKYLGSEKLAQELINVIQATSWVMELTVRENRFDFAEHSSFVKLEYFHVIIFSANY